jgi:hypothetical protein
VSNTYKHYPKKKGVCNFLRYPRHRQQLAEYYYARKMRLPRVRIQSYIIKEGAWADQWLSTADYSEKKRQGMRKIRRLKRRRQIKKYHPRVTWMSAADK